MFIVGILIATIFRQFHIDKEILTIFFYYFLSFDNNRDLHEDCLLSDRFLVCPHNTLEFQEMRHM